MNLKSVQTFGYCFMADKCRVFKIALGDFSATHGASLTLNGDPFHTKEAEDVVARQFDRMNTGLKTHGTLNEVAFTRALHDFTLFFFQQDRL